MRTDRGWRRFYATGWLVSAGITLVAFRMWQLHVREVEYLIGEEWAQTTDDILWRRSKLGLHVPPGTVERLERHL